MKLGLWGARMDNSGLGMQTWEFYENMHPDKTFVVDISSLEKTPIRVLKQYPERYPKNAKFIQGFPNRLDIEDFLQGLDVVFIAESAYNMDLYRIAREMGVKTAVQYNYEFFDWMLYTQFVLPDLFIAPTTWHWDEVERFIENTSTRHVYLPVPINRSKIKYRKIESATSFVHIAGRQAAHDRNGTYTFLEALKLSEGDLHGTVYSQDRNLTAEIKNSGVNVKIVENVEHYADIYKKGNVLVLPRRYGGNCLPMHEALAAGMPVIMSKLSPQVDFLPDRWLVAAKLQPIEFTPRTKIDVYETDAIELCIKMKWFQTLSSVDMGEQSDMASSLAETISWETMRPKYQEVFEALCHV